MFRISHRTVSASHSSPAPVVARWSYKIISKYIWLWCMVAYEFCISSLLCVESRFGVLCFLFCVMFSASETLYQSARRAPGKSPRLDRSRGSFRCTKLQLRWNNSTSFNVKKRNAFYFWCCLNIYGSEWKTLFSFDKKKRNSARWFLLWNVLVIAPSIPTWTHHI